jgi:membrane protease YdiL (CAAX protease family)
MPSFDTYCYSIHTKNQGKCSGSFSVSSTPLFATPSSVQEPKPHPSGVNLRLIGQSAIGQILLGITIWTGGPQYQTLIQHCHFSGLAVLGGLVGSVPLIALSRQVEQSESYLVSGLNLSTNMAVLRFFGSTRQPIVALLLSLALSSLTGLVEETTFRGQILPALTNSESFGNGNLVVGAALSTFVFAILHTNPAAFFPTNNNTESVIDNLVLLMFQLINGAWFTVLYVASGTNLVIPIVAHTLYDTYTFYKTHMVDVAGQMDYAQQQLRKSSMAGTSRTNSPIQQKWIQSKGADFVSQAKEAFYLMDTNRDGVVSVKELKIALYSYGIRLSPAQWKQVKGSADLDGSGDIDCDEFLEFMGPTGSTTQAVRYTLFGPI